jgi:Flp pilus assembly protein TadB
MVVLAVTGWPSAAFASAVIVVAFPAMWSHRHDQSDERARVEAVAAWTEMLRDAVSSGRGVQEAIAVTAPLAPAVLRPAVLSLRARSVRGPLAPALRSFVDEVGDPMADLVGATLILAATREVRELSDLLGALAQTTRQRAALRLTAEAGRAGLRTTARAIGGVTALSAAGMFALQPSYLAPYATPVGQLVLAAAGAWFLLGFWGLSRLGRPSPPRRLTLREVTP